MKRFLVLLLVLVMTVPVQARRHPNVPQMYAYGSSIDIQGGFVGMPYAISGDAGTALGVGCGGEFQLRYSYFFQKHWGFFVSFSTFNVDIDDVGYFGTVNRSDGGRYRYGSLPRGAYYNNYDGNGRYVFGRDNDFFAAAFQVAAAYRYDFGCWSLRPMSGVGF